MRKDICFTGKDEKLTVAKLQDSAGYPLCQLLCRKFFVFFYSVRDPDCLVLQSPVPVSRICLYGKIFIRSKVGWHEITCIYITSDLSYFLFRGCRIEIKNKAFPLKGQYIGWQDRYGLHHIKLRGISLLMRRNGNAVYLPGFFLSLDGIFQSKKHFSKFRIRSGDFNSPFHANSHCEDSQRKCIYKAPSCKFRCICQVSNCLSGLCLFLNQKA